jgi:hypothetical protein
LLEGKVIHESKDYFMLLPLTFFVWMRFAIPEIFNLNSDKPGLQLACRCLIGKSRRIKVMPGNCLLL